jgi:hypothetical protein
MQCHLGAAGWNLGGQGKSEQVFHKAKESIHCHISERMSCENASG